jgi:Beta propeller domain
LVAGSWLFDVSDPTRPSVVDTEVLGDDSPVVWDHHALLTLANGRLAVPSTTWRAVAPTGCTQARRDQLMAEALAVETALSELYNSASPDQARIEELSLRLDAIWSDPCVSPPIVTDTAVVVADVGGRAVDVVERVTVTTSEPGTRVFEVGDRWAVLAGTHLVVVDPDGAVAIDLALT